jgi:hypothetical protein
MMKNCRKPVRNLAVLLCIISIALIAAAFFHFYLHYIDFDEGAGSSHHCLLCTVFSHTILSFNASDFLPIQSVTNQLIMLMPILSGGSSSRASIVVRAPPCLRSSSYRVFIA